MRAVVVVIALGIATPAFADDLLGNVVNRAYVSAYAGDGWTTRYTYDRYRSTWASTGAAVGTVLGVDNFGLDLSLGAVYDPGTTPNSDVMPRDPLWLVDIGFGLASSPVMYRTPSVELRLDLRIRGGLILRQGCDDIRCGHEGGEPTVGLIPLFSAGMLGWFGEDACYGWGIDVVFARGQIGDVHKARPTEAELLPPTWLVRVSWLPYRGKRSL